MQVQSIEEKLISLNFKINGSRNEAKTVYFSNPVAKELSQTYSEVTLDK